MRSTISMTTPTLVLSWRARLYVPGVAVRSSILRRESPSEIDDAMLSRRAGFVFGRKAVWIHADWTCMGGAAQAAHGAGCRRAALLARVHGRASLQDRSKPEVMVGLGQGRSRPCTTGVMRELNITRRG